MATKLKMSLVIVAVLAATFHSSMAETYVVGDTFGWQIPQADPNVYSTWASRKSFTVGDILVFNFTTGLHTVAEVTKNSFDPCNIASPISLTTNGPASITLSTAGDHYFFCTFPGHCGLNQKLAINVSAAPSTSPAPATPPTTRRSPPPAATPATPPNTRHSPPPAVAPAPKSTPSKSTPSPSPSPSPSLAPKTSPTNGSTNSPSPSSSTPSSVSAPPPPSSAPSFAGAALPLTFLAVALAFFY